MPSSTFGPTSSPNATNSIAGVIGVPTAAVSRRRRRSAQAPQVRATTPSGVPCRRINDINIAAAPGPQAGAAPSAGLAAPQRAGLPPQDRQGTHAVPGGAETCRCLRADAETEFLPVRRDFDCLRRVTMHSRTAMVRKGSPVRVRQRASENALLMQTSSS
jgi:hypothetical protein